ncbi:YbbR-like domain-containing protein [Pontibacter sp. CAU 1760]
MYNERQLIPIKPLPEEVSINVTGKGWKLLRKALRLEVQPAEIYIRNLPRNNYLLGSALRPALVNSLDGLQLNFVVTDTIYFNFNAKVSERIALQFDPAVPLTNGQHVVLGKIRVSPDSVTFTGPSSLIDSLPKPFLLRLPEGQQELTSTTKLSIPLKYDYESLIRANVEEVQVEITVKGLAQDEQQVAPDLINKPQGDNFVIRPPLAMVRFQVREDSTQLLNRNSFKVVLDYSKFNPQDSTVVPELIQKPRGIRNMQMWPEKFKVLKQ